MKSLHEADNKQVCILEPSMKIFQPAKPSHFQTTCTPQRNQDRRKAGMQLHSCKDLMEAPRIAPMWVSINKTLTRHSIACHIYNIICGEGHKLKCFSMLLAHQETIITLDRSRSTIKSNSSLQSSDGHRRVRNTCKVDTKHNY